MHAGGGTGRGLTHRADARVRFIQPEVVAGDVHRAVAGALHAQRQLDLHEGVLVRALKHALHGVHRGGHLRANVMSGLAGWMLYDGLPKPRLLFITCFCFSCRHKQVPACLANHILAVNKQPAC